jgi:hypothetical protein
MSANRKVAEALRPPMGVMTAAAEGGVRRGGEKGHTSRSPVCWEYRREKVATATKHAVEIFVRSLGGT